MTKPTSTTWYTIKTTLASAAAAAAGGASAAAPEILIYQDIGDSWWSEDPITAANFRAELQAIQASAITVRILSVGGSVPDGLAIYNALRDHPATITTINDGMAASIASLIFCAGDVRIAAANSMTMVHAPWTYMDGNATALRDAADMLDAWANAMAASYAQATGRPKAEVLAWLTDGKDHYFTADEALAAGLATQVGDVVAPAAQAVAMAGALARYSTARAVNASLQPFFVAAAATATAAAAHNNHPQQITPGAAGPQPQELVAMPTPTTSSTNPAATTAADPQSAAASQAQLDQARAAGVRAEADRRQAIVASFAPFASHTGVAEVQAACLADPAVTVIEADRRILAHLAKGVTSAAGGYVVTMEDERDKFRASAVQSIMARSSVVGADGKPVRAESANPLRGHTLVDIARASLQRAGINASGMDRMQVVGAAFTQGTSDFPILLENAMYRTLQGAYAIAPDTWTRFCARGSVVDFRINPRYRIGSLGNLDAKNELGEFKNKAIPDGEKASISVGTKGNLINLSREAIINDDLGAFIGLAAMLGRAAKRTVEADVYALLASNPTLSDGIALFHATHGNLAGSGAAPSVTSVDAMRVAMLSQKDVSKNDFLDMRPAVVLAPVSLGGALRLVNQNEYDPSTSNKFQVANIVRGLFRDVVDTPRLSGTAWYSFADPQEAPVIEVAFLDGNDMPYLESQQGWSVDGTAWKVRLDFGVGAVDYRGAYLNPGA